MPEYPAQCMEYILKDTWAKAVLANGKHRHELIDVIIRELTITVDNSISRQSVEKADRKQSVIIYLEKNDKTRVSKLINVIELIEGGIKDFLRQMVNEWIIAEKWMLSEISSKIKKSL